MIKGKSSLDGTPIEKLSDYSRKKIIKICDDCKIELQISYCDLILSRKKRKSDIDRCHKCAMKNQSGENNPSKKQNTRKKISEKLKGKSKRFKKGFNPRIHTIRINTAGYVLVHDYKNNKKEFEHKLIMEKNIKRKLKGKEQIHHIDGDKKNNNIENLLLVNDASEHMKVHSQIENLFFELYKKNIVYFDNENKSYKLNPLIELSRFEESLGFENIAIKQKKQICVSRLDVNLKSEVIRDVFLDVPMMAANMSTVTNAEFIIKLSKLGAMGVMHRACSDEEILSSIEKISKECEWVAGSIGVSNKDIDLFKNMIINGCNIIFIDIAHGYSEAVFDMAKKIKKYSPLTKVVVGNTTNINMLYECYEFIDAIKVGIAQGFACETKNTAGCTEKQFSAIYKFKEVSKKLEVPIISDGGIREPSDFVKAIGAGANSIMAGKIFAECPESAAELGTDKNNNPIKIYAGMASQYIQEAWKGGVKEGTCTEGGVRYLSLGLPINKMLEKYSGALRSGITYAGAKDIKSYQNNVEFIKI